MVTPALFHLTPGNGMPLYRQLVEQVKAALAAGLLRPGEQVPSHRDLARDLVLAPLTVARAYALLEREGLLHTERGRGTFVAEVPTEGVAEEAEAALRERAAGLVRHARVLGLDLDAVRQTVERAWAEADERGGG